MEMEGPWAAQVGTENKYQYNGKEINEDWGVNLSDYGARWYDAAVGRWWSVDPLAEKYVPFSSFNFTLNNPIKYLDPNGNDVYLFYYVQYDEQAATKAFMMAAVTRAIDLLQSENFSSDDMIKIEGVSDLGELKESVESNTKEYSKKYGKTKEFGIWSHGSFDGPVGGKPASNGGIDGSPKQISAEAWGQIDFNWSSDNAKAIFYGCRTGKDPDDKEGGKKAGVDQNSFSQKISKNKNMSNVDVWGQTQKSYPSPYTDARIATPDIVQDNHKYPTYFVGSKKGYISGFLSRCGPTYAHPFAVYKNGQFVGYTYQPGQKLLK